MKSCLTLSGFLSLLLACGWFSTGCRLGQPASSGFASVIITNQTAARILDTTVAVFREQGYHETPSGEALTFEKEGTRGDTIAYEGVINAQNGAVAMIRVRVQCVGAGPGAQRLQGQAYVVTGAGDHFMEDEIRIANFRSGPYQDLLDEVAKRLKQP